MRRFVVAVIHWAARCAALLVVGTFILRLAEDLINPYSVPPASVRDWAGILLLTAGIIGMAAAWKWEVPGALLSLLALVAFASLAGTRRYDIVSFAAIPGVLYLWDWLLRRKRPEAAMR